MGLMEQRGLELLALSKDYNMSIAAAAREKGWNPNTARRYTATARAKVSAASDPVVHERSVPLRLTPPAMPTDHITEIKERKRPVPSRRFLRAAVFDLETTDFDATGYEGILVCCSILPLDSDDTTTLRIEFADNGDDQRVLEETLAALEEYDILIGQNVAAYDLNWLSTRNEYYGGDMLRTWWYIDTYQVARSMALKSGGKSLGNLGDFYGLAGEKTTIFKCSWSKVRSPYPGEFERHMEEVIYHCEQDVLLTRNLFDAQFPSMLTLRNCQIKQTKWATGLPRRRSLLEAA